MCRYTTLWNVIANDRNILQYGVRQKVMVYFEAL